ncbi:unnamed protein product [Musa acuminata var. zebrina]
MVSKRQKEAKKRFNDANPQLLSDSKPEHSSTSTSKKEKEKKKKGLKKKKGEAAFKKGKKTGGAATRKHPLRVPGMRPGESCFICKATDHIAKLCPEKAMWEKKKICLLCRQHGHSLKNCPEKSDDTNKKKLCYNCGEVGHSLSRCSLPLKDGGTKFASCFICKELGHLSKNCPNNTHGVYPKGGSCRICGEVTHLAKHCPNKGNKSLDTSTGQQKFFSVGKPKEHQKIRFGGDDLEDDFMEESVLANAVSGMAVHDECKLKFLDLKAKRNYRFIVFKIDEKIQQVTVEKLGQPDETYDDFTASLPADECRYAVFDFDFVTDEHCQKSKIFFISWAPDTSRVRSKMLYASSKDRFKRELDGIQVELQATDPSEMSIDIVKGRAL